MLKKKSKTNNEDTLVIIEEKMWNMGYAGALSIINMAREKAGSRHMILAVETYQQVGKKKTKLVALMKDEFDTVEELDKEQSKWVLAGYKVHRT